ncbi:MAG TPA: 2-amino-4-hydroxy-6-hydroxymethyldihydropteridine diphosphokinase [Anaerolineales bacterium]|nr:2-amino-4-hydroxy-6-hydroxymethyldihydropteridine diphosphokinase [Anaerolineales bacterium]
MDPTKNEPEMHTIYLGLGTNSGDRAANLEAAIQALPPQVEVQERSPIYQTPPWGYTNQPDFLNLVLEARTQLTPPQLLKFLKSLEDQVGRTATFRWGPREIDIDILLYDDLVLETDELVIPHPQMQARAFVLVPLADLAPNLVHPKLKQTNTDLLEQVDTTAIQTYHPETPSDGKAV